MCMRLEVIEKEKEVKTMKRLSKKPTHNQLETKIDSLQVENHVLKKSNEELTIEIVEKDEELTNLKRKLSNNHELNQKKKS